MKWMSHTIAGRGDAGYQCQGSTRNAAVAAWRLPRQAYVVLFGLFAAAYASGAAGQTTGDSFDVTVEPSESQSEVVTQGPASLDGATLTVSTLEQILVYLRLRSNQFGQGNESESKPQKAALLASLGPVIYAAVGEGSQDQEIGAEFDRLSTFADISYEFSDHDSTGNTPAHDADTVAITAGADYRYSSNLIFGLALAYTDSENEFSGGLGELNLDGLSLAAFGNWYVSESWYVDGIARLGDNDYDSTRRDNAGGVATGKTSSTEYSLNLGSGYQFSLSGWTLGPRVSINYTDISIDGYSERNSTQALRYGDQDVESLKTHVGAEATYAIRTEFGVVQPQANIEWVHEFEDDGRLIVARQASGGPAFGIPVDSLDSDFFRVGLGAAILLTHGRMLFARYESELGRANRDVHTLSLGGRLEF